MKDKPRLYTTSKDHHDEFVWASAGWGGNRELMNKARKHIAAGSDVRDTVKRLSRDFRVHRVDEMPPVKN